MLHTSEKVIRNKVGLLNLAEELGNISKACKIIGYSRETFYRYREAVDQGGVDALMEKWVTVTSSLNHYRLLLSDW